MLGDEDGGRLVEQFKGWSTAVVGALMASIGGTAAGEGLSMAAAEAGEEGDEGEEGEDTFDDLDDDEDDDRSEVRVCVV